MELTRCLLIEQCETSSVHLPFEHRIARLRHRTLSRKEYGQGTRRTALSTKQGKYMPF